MQKKRKETYEEGGFFLKIPTNHSNQIGKGGREKEDEGGEDDVGGLKSGGLGRSGYFAQRRGATSHLWRHNYNKTITSGKVGENFHGGGRTLRRKEKSGGVIFGRPAGSEEKGKQKEQIVKKRKDIP